MHTKVEDVGMAEWRIGVGMGMGMGGGGGKKKATDRSFLLSFYIWGEGGRRQGRETGLFIYFFFKIFF